MRTFALFLATALSLAAQLTPQQRADDFRSIAAVYNKNYAPYEWKRDSAGFDMLRLQPWLTRVNAAKDDLEYYEICIEYVASLQDAHSRFRIPSVFVARLGFGVDIYGGKLLIDQIDRTALPAARFPFAIGDELISIDGKPADQLLASYLPLVNNSNPVARRRVAASMLTVRSQARQPRAAQEIGDNADAVVLLASGEMATYSIPWTKTGTPLTAIGPTIDFYARPQAPQPRASATGEDEQQPDYLQPLTALRRVRVPDEAVTGIGVKMPLFALPAGFVQRQGRLATDNFYSGTYTANGVRIGYIRVPIMEPLGSTAAAYREFATEIAFFQGNTGTLIVDVMRNPGGFVDYAETLCQYLIPGKFRTLGFEIRATQSWLLDFQTVLQSARRQNAEKWIVDSLELLLSNLEQAYRERRGRTGPLPLGVSLLSLDLMVDAAPSAYTKPLIVLADEFSASGGDMLPAIVQDNARGRIVGMRTMGAGGSVGPMEAGPYSEGSSQVTFSLMNRKEPIVTTDFPTAPYVEGIGVRPDVPLDIMTRENLMNGNRPFLDAVTRLVTGR